MMLCQALSLANCKSFATPDKSIFEGKGGGSSIWEELLGGGKAGGAMERARAAAFEGGKVALWVDFGINNEAIFSWSELQ
jgi:hypothetical protein